jgi:hypothetical protein
MEMSGKAVRINAAVFEQLRGAAASSDQGQGGMALSRAGEP